MSGEQRIITYSALVNGRGTNFPKFVSASSCKCNSDDIKALENEAKRMTYNAYLDAYEIDTMKLKLSGYGISRIPRITTAQKKALGAYYHPRLPCYNLSLDVNDINYNISFAMDWNDYYVAFAFFDIAEAA